MQEPATRRSTSSTTPSPRGSSPPGDQWPQVWERMCAADVLAWGTPVYRHDMTGALKTVIERMNDEPTKRNRPDCPGRRQYVNAPLYPAWAER
ncbi:hypothetical protein BKH31_04445 [Actinomyces oris]|uniref:NADPH-dependent FMN reductase-like domain-containing protein n=1 Tax=Actinomyces oris TaxID=544580 RepID=A0A1Q8VHN2_9ACTO|nr:hypothetical protein BKH31_04445 [Actinomyces oris]